LDADPPAQGVNIASRMTALFGSSAAMERQARRAAFFTRFASRPIFLTWVL
jgi:hypothetical protein